MADVDVVWGAVFGVAFAIEGIGFFTEAIFIAIYLYSWDRFPPKRHFLVGIPIAISGVVAALFVMSVNSWMNDPSGFTLDASGRPTNINPWTVILGNSTTRELVHPHAVGRLHRHRVPGGDDLRGADVAGRPAAVRSAGLLDLVHVRRHLRAGAAGVRRRHGAAHVAATQPTKLAASEGLDQSQADVPMAIGGVYYGGQLHYAVTIPDLLLVLAYHDPGAEVQGLDATPVADQPPVNVVHLSFDLMVGLGTALLALAGWFALVWWRRRRLPRQPVVPFGRGGGWARGGAGVVGRMGGHRGRPSALDRLPDHAHRGRGQPGQRPRVAPVLIVVVYVGLVFALISVLRRLTRAELPPELEGELDPVVGGAGRDGRPGPTGGVASGRGDPPTAVGAGA